MSFVHCCLAFSSISAVSQTEESCCPSFPSKKSPSFRGWNFSSLWKSGCGPEDSNKASYLAKDCKRAKLPWPHNFGHSGQ